MNAKFLLLSLSVAALGSCSTAYKSGQTPDDVYFSPVRSVPVAQRYDDTPDRNTVVYADTYPDIRLGFRDRRWRDLNEYDYTYSPYNYCYNNYYNTGYYYNPYYYPAPIYTYYYTPKVNTTPRMVNLNAYHGYNPNTAANIKNGGAVQNSNTYNPGRNGFGNTIRQAFTPKQPANNTPSSNSDNRTYTPSSSNTNSSSSSSSGSSSSSSGSTNTRPARGN